MNEYTKQANDFLLKTQSEISKQLIGNISHFDDDIKNGITRPVYNIVIRRTRLLKTKDGKSYYKPVAYSFKFGDSIANMQDGKTPTNYDILACLTKYNPSTFENFCSEYGYNTDSRQALKTYKAVKAEYKGLRTIYTLKELEAMADIQ